MVNTVIQNQKLFKQEAKNLKCIFFKKKKLKNLFQTNTK